MITRKFQLFLVGVDCGLRTVNASKFNSPQFSIILALKHPELAENKNANPKSLSAPLLKAAKAAYAQIDTAKYITIFKKRGIMKYIKLGVAFAGKDLQIYSL